MENKKKKKCCSRLQSARLSTQTKLALITVSLLFIILIVGSMILNIYLISSFTYKEIYKLIDIDEFNELFFAENNIENIQLQFENTFKNTLLSIVNLYKELSNETLTDKFYNVKNNNFNLLFWNGSNNTNNTNNTNDTTLEIDPKSNMIFTCNNDDNSSCIDSSKNDYNFYTYLGIYLETIFYNKKIFMYNNKIDHIMHLFIICDYNNKDSGENKVSFYYPGYINEIQKIDENLIKEYVINKIVQKIKVISMYKDILANNLDYYENLFLLPFYDDVSDSDNYSFDSYNLTNKIFNKDFLSTSNATISEVCFMLVPKRDPQTQEFLEITMENINENIGQIFLLIGIMESSEIIFEKLNNQNSGLYLLRTNYLFPYELANKGSCKKIINLGTNSENKKKVDLSELKYLDDCFDKTKEVKDDKTEYDRIIEEFSIFRNDISKTYNSNIVKLYRNIEKNYLQKNTTSYGKTVTKISTLNDIDFKIKKTYSPLNIIYQIKYFYPIDNIKMDILIKDEGYSKYILDENKKILNKILLTGLLILIICVVILEIIFLIILKYFTEELNKPLDIINNPYFITGQIKEEENENKNKSLNKINIISDKKIHIDEFKELIKSVSESLKSETEFKQKINKQEEDDMKLEMEYLNKEFEKNKIFNIMIDENKINNILEESNYSNEIIKHKTNIENVKNDSFVKKSYLFREYVKVDEFEDFENSGENNLVFDSNTIFKDENTLQNPNSLFYDLFKTTFDENYVKKMKELKLKKENEKKKKNKSKNNYSFKNDEEENLKDKTNNINNSSNSKKKLNIFDFEKENNSEENDLNIDFKDINDIKIEDSGIKNEDELLKLYTESKDDKNENDILNENKNIKNNNIIEEEIDTTKF